jgi:hypothetical protein
MGAAAAVLVLATASLPLLSPSRNSQQLFFDPAPDGSGALFPGAPSAQITATCEWSAYRIGLLGVRAATLIRSNVSWVPQRPDELALRETLRQLRRVQPEEAVRSWDESDLEERILQGGNGVYSRWHFHSGAWLIVMVWLVVWATLWQLASTFVSVRALRRERIGLCVVCGFDQTGISGKNRCPECGATHTVADREPNSVGGTAR